MKFELVIKCDNSAFEDTRYEVARLLRKCANDLDNQIDYGKLLDVNGNAVGRYNFIRR